MLHRQGPFLEFLEATKRACAQRTLESLAPIEEGARRVARARVWSPGNALSPTHTGLSRFG